MFAYVRWKQFHPYKTWYGASATVCIDMFEEQRSCRFLPVQRIACRCAYIVLPVTFGDMVETVFIACLISIKYSV